MKKSKIVLFGYLVLYGLIGGFVGGMVGWLFMNNHKYIEFNLTTNQSNVIIIILAIVAVILVMTLMNVYRKIKKLRMQNISIENEDEIEERIEKLLIVPPVILGLITTIGLFMINIIINIAEKPSLLSMFIMIITMFVGAMLSYGYLTQMGKIYPERDYPKPGDKKLNEKLINMMDSGEQYITLLALHKTYVLNQQLIITFIAISSIYSLVSNHNQFVSVTLMIILYLVNTMYFTKKATETI